jgi:hypothetical protein
MVGTVHFHLENPDGRVAEAAAGPPAADNPQGLGQEAAVGATVPVAPRLPFALDPGLYTQLWTSQLATTTAEEMKEDMESYVELYTDYPAIQTTILNSSDWLGFLTILAGNQVVLVHSLGLFSSGLGRPSTANNCMFGLLGEKVGSGLPPIVMVPLAGLAPWIRVQTHYAPTEASLQTLESESELTIPRPAMEPEDAQRSVQNICFVPRAWGPYFLAPMTP